MLKEKMRIEKLINVNFKREKETYGNMFKSRKGVNEYVEANRAPDEPKYVTCEEQELKQQLAMFEDHVAKMIKDKLEEFSFEVKQDWHECNIPEVRDLQDIIDNTIDSYKILIKAGKIKEAQMVLEKVKDTMYAKEHLKLVMGMDFARPTAKMIEMAKTNNIDLKDPNVI